ncbi:amino acid adenylation domain-containing protein [Streptosporangium sp. NPDC087985]|uniref:non-ribosomal peptide synthetase n=1 Tax=Streptosporangium sp. NPDC087985 TaxID=3366196 RepID=UPI0038143B6B
MTERTGGHGDVLREAVADLWRDRLGVTEIQDDDDFFLLGGDSILAIEVATALRTLMGTELDLDILYDYPEFGRLVAALATGPHSKERELRELAPAEERVWAAEKLNPGTPLYHVCARYRFDGKLDLVRLRRTLNALVAGHDALRRGFEAPGRAFTVGEVPAPSCRWVEAHGVPESTVRQLLDDDARMPFDLARPPLLRALVVDRGEAGDLLQLTVHHLVCDGASLSLLESHLQRLYLGDGTEPGGSGERVATVPRAVSTRGQNLAAAMEYWRRTLADCPGGLPVPHDLPRRKPVGVSGATQAITFPSESLAALSSLAKAERLSPFMAWVAAYAAGLAAVTGERDLVISVPVSSRGPEQRQEIGLFVDVLPLRFVLPPGATARVLVRLVRRVVTEALAHSRLPGRALIEDLWPNGNRAGSSLTQATLTYVDASECGLRAGDSWAERELVPTGTAKYDVLWSVTRRANATVAELEYRTDLFSAAAAADLHRQLVSAVGEAFADPDAAMPRLSDPTRSASAAPEVRPYEPVHERVRRQAAARPDAIAIQHRDRRLTYRELDERASAVAAGLHAAGLRRGDVVAVAMERGPDMVTAFLGILYAGCAYLPVDARQPAERTRSVAGVAARAALVADGRHAELLADLMPVLWLRALLRQAAPAWPAAGPVRLIGEDVAYVMSTSGSSGVPKAVVIPHRAITRLVPDANYAAIDSADRVAHLSNPAFDAATFEIWGALAAGATLVVEEQDVVLSPTRLQRFLEQRRITVLWLTATLLNQVADFAPDALRNLRVLLFGGEKADERRLARLLAGRPPARVVNGYGPTENTTFSTFHDVTPADLAEGSVPIGRPISGSTAYALDPAGRPVQVGEVGELFVGGDGLAHGYLGAPEMTAAAFVPDPFDARAGRRLYRTGDQVRLLPGGRFEFLGRHDDQVKIRGFRVELGEIDAALRRQDEVADAVVLAHATDDGSEIVACVTSAGEPAVPLDIPALGARLRRELPEYMVPTRLVALDRIPVNANGKADRSAVLAAAGIVTVNEPAAREPASGASAPGRPVEAEGDRGAADVEDEVTAMVSAVWCKVLGTDEARPEDHFLMLGGHSIKALRLLSQLEQEFGVSVELADFFADPTLYSLIALFRRPVDTNAGRSADARTD